MKKQMIAVALSGVLALGCVGCAQQKADSTEQDKTEQATSASQEATASSTNWESVKSAAEAAKGAGFEAFSVPESMTINSVAYKKPTFAYADGVAQATYKGSSCELVLCKADGTHTAAMTELDATNFVSTWTKTYGDTSVTCYGPARGATVFATWKDGTKEYGVTYRSTSGDEVTMDSHELEDIVAAVMAADSGSASADTTASADKTDADGSDSTDASTSTDSDVDTSGFISEDEAKSTAVATVGTSSADGVTAELVVGGDAPHYAVTVPFGSTSYIVEVDATTGVVWDIEEGSAVASDETSTTDATGTASDATSTTDATGTASDATSTTDATSTASDETSTTDATSTASDETSAAGESDDAEGDASVTSEGPVSYITEDEAKSIAVSNAGIGIPDDVSAELVEGGDAPHYVVNLTSDGSTTTLEIDAVTGDVW